MDYYAIGQNIRKSRREHGLSQEELAEKVNISTTHMSHIETGNTKLSLPVLVEIAKSLNASVDSLIDSSEDNTTGSILQSINFTLSQCNNNELEIIRDIVVSTKLTLDKHNI